MNDLQEPKNDEVFKDLYQMVYQAKLKVIVDFKKWSYRRYGNFYDITLSGVHLGELHEWASLRTIFSHTLADMLQRKA